MERIFFLIGVGIGSFITFVCVRDWYKWQLDEKSGIIKKSKNVIKEFITDNENTKLEPLKELVK